MKTRLMSYLYGAAALTLSMSAVPAMAQVRQVVLASSGGVYEKIIREHWLNPFEVATGIKVVVVPSDNTAETRAKVQAMIVSGNVTWDIFLEGEMDAEASSHLNRVENIDDFCLQFKDRADLLPGTCKASGVLFGRGATLITYNKERFPNGGPTTWKEFWDTKAYPGVRTMPAQADAWRQLTVALLADGVPVQDLYPLDVDRAFKKLDELRPSVGLWWKSGDQTTQGFRNGEYDTGFMWLTRTMALKNEGQPIVWSYDGALLVGDRYAVVKGAPHKAEALALLKFFLDSPEIQGKISEALAISPPSIGAYQYMSAEARANMPSAEQIKSKMVIPDAEWINVNKAMLIARWNAWIQN
ncbi:ABC transporter substrate-binding protein [Microvirga sp. VF16]|uniref:ABC transporter substrate-binding protein n=1 Tax=Microvirga sp. VF16 TaxID=2807101 RepID=UPI00193D832A|nr:ABC transporter substrate-binding protein [Microvirga sp. VF16]QRM32210.1 ABC transporter substrate-binding protein [Microvirga sp. VF16]